MEHTLGFTNFLSSADAIAQLILGILLLFSLGTWYLIFVKSFAYLSLRQRSKVFLNWFWHLPDLSAPELAQQWPTEQRSNAFSNLLRHALAAAQSYRQKTQRNPSSPSHQTGFNQSLQRVLKRALDAERSTLEFGQTFIATVAATAPFVGLLGTVWGIYHALMAISASGQATLDKVAGPVGEALIMTGIGLAVAIPAAIAYNVFARSNRNTLARLNSFADDLLLNLGVAYTSSAEPAREQ